MTLKSHGHRAKSMAPSDSLISKTDLDLSANLSALAQKLWSKMSFCNIVANVTHLRSSYIENTQDIFLFIQRPQPKLPYVTIS